MPRIVPAAIVTLILIGLAANRVNAQTGPGRLLGLVVDAQQAVLPGVTVTMTSPALIGAESTVTEADGRYLFPSLPSGTYSATFELSGFRTLTRDNIVIVVATTIRIDAELAVASMAESVVVTGHSPVVDVTAGKVGVHFSDKVLESVPTATDVWSILGQTPGIRMQGFDVGGSHKSQQSGFETFGVQGQERVFSDGVDTTEGTSGVGLYPDYYANQEVAISAVGADVEMNSPGAAIVTTIKSGGNELRGSASFTYEGARFVGNNRDAGTDLRGFTGQKNLKFWELHAEAGGPIVRDKLWFFGAYNHFSIDRLVSGIPQEEGTDPGIFDNYTTKETYKPADKDTIIGYVQAGRKQKPNRGLGATRTLESTFQQDSWNRVFKGEYQRIWTNRLFTSLRVGYFGSHNEFPGLVDPVTSPPRMDRATGIHAGAAEAAPLAERSKPQVFAQGTYYLPDHLGSHEFKFGFEFLNDSYRYGSLGGIPIQYRDFEGATDQIKFIDVGRPEDLDKTWTNSELRTLRYAGYLQDRWTWSDRMTVTAGVRLDYQRPSYAGGRRDPIQSEIFEATTIPGRTLLTKTNLAPRVGLAYSLGPAHSRVLKAFYGRYYHNFADTFSGADPSGFNQQVWEFVDPNANRVYDGPQELGRRLFSFGGEATDVNPKLKTPYTDELSASYEQQLWGESSIRASYVRKNTREAIPLYFVPYAYTWIGHLTVPTDFTTSSPLFGTETFHLFDIPESLYGGDLYLFDNMPDGTFTYDTIELAMQKRFTGRVFVQTSFDYTWRNELRSPDLSFDPLQSDPIGNGFFLNPNPSIPLRQKTTTWEGRLLGRYEFAYQIACALNLRYQSGYAYSRVVEDDLPGNPGSFFVDNLNRHRSDNTALLDIRLDKRFSIGGYDITANVDVYNVLNSNAVTNFFLTNDNFGQIIATLDPRTVEVGVRVTF